MAFLPALSQEKTPQGIEAVNPDRALKCRRGGVPRALGAEQPGTGSLRDGSNALDLATFHQIISGHGQWVLLFRFSPGRGQPRRSQGTSQPAEVSLPGGVPGGEGPCSPGGAQEPAGDKKVRAMRNASRHGADLAYSNSVAGALAGHSRPPGGDADYRRLHRYPASAARS
jgi:hypothetical protein